MNQVEQDRFNELEVRLGKLEAYVGRLNGRMEKVVSALEKIVETMTMEKGVEIPESLKIKKS